MAHRGINIQSKEGQAYEQLLKVCLSFASKQDATCLDVLKQSISQLSEDFESQVESFKQKISEMPLFALILLWAEQVCNDKLLGNHYMKMMENLVETGLISLVQSLEDLSQQDPCLIIDKIRSYKEWSFSKREDHVLLYQAFLEWLSKKTFGYVLEAKDSDRLATKSRQIPYDTYIKILAHLDLREQILTKIFYLGGQRPLEDVLSIKIEDIDFSNACIRFSEYIYYPRHLFEDITNYIESRKEGFVFMGRNAGERISPSTPFRALKIAASKLKLDPEFTFKDFTKNI